MKEQFNLQIFENKHFGRIRTVINGSNEPLFCLADVCSILGLKQGDVRQRLDDGVVSTQPITDSLGREQQANFVNEDGLYDTILDSRKPEAKQFRKWVTSEVLPSIRKHGAYMTSDVLEKAIASPDFTIGLLTKLKEEQERRLVAENKVKRQQSIIEEQTPLANLGDAVMKYDGDITINELAKLLCQNGYETGERRLRYRLKEDGFLMQNGDPTQKSVENRLMAIVKGIYMHPINGETMYHKTMITTKGQKYFINKYLKPREYAN